MKYYKIYIVGKKPRRDNFRDAMITITAQDDGDAQKRAHDLADSFTEWGAHNITVAVGRL